MKAMKIWTVVGVSAILLAGCGAPDSASPASGTSANQTTGAGATSGSQQTSGAPNNTSTSSQQSTTNAAKTPLPARKTIEYTAEGMKETRSAKLFRSSQGYYIYVLDQFKAMAEEPGVDDVTLNANQNFVMKVTMLPRNANLNREIENAKLYLKALGTPVQENPQQVFTDPFFKQHTVAALHATDGKMFTKQVLLVKISGVPFKFVIQTPTETESIAALQAMIQTIGVLDAH